MYKDVEVQEPITLEQLDIRQFISLQEDKDGPLLKLRFSLDTTWLKKDFILDLVIWNLSEDNLEQTERVVRYVLDNFNRLFETGWTILYHYLCKIEPYPSVARHTIQEFFVEQVDFESHYYTIQLEINCDHLKDGQARYCFVVATTCNYRKWTISDDDMRIYMIGNKACGVNDNNDDCQMRDTLEICEDFYEMGEWLSEGYDIMRAEGFQFAESFKK